MIENIQNEITLQSISTEASYLPNDAQASVKSSELPVSTGTSDSSSSLSDDSELPSSDLPPSYAEAVSNGAIRVNLEDDAEPEDDSDSDDTSKRRVVTCDWFFEGKQYRVSIIIIISTAIVATFAVVLGISRRNAQAFQDNQFGLLELAPGSNPVVE